MIGNRLKELRNDKDILQKELAEKLGLTQQTISLYESNKREPDYETLHKIANFFDVSTDYILGLTNERSSADKIKKAISDDPELVAFWDKLSKRPDLQLLFKQTKDLSPKAIHQVIRIMKAIEDEEGKNGS